MPIVSREPSAVLVNDGLLEVATFGRRRIYTDKEINEGTILEVLNDALAVHNINTLEMQNLINYYLGKQKILDRIRSDEQSVNNKVVLNYANSIVRDIVGYTYGKDIEYVQKDQKLIETVEELNNLLQYEDAPLADMSTAVYTSICGVGYQFSLPSDDYLDETPEVGIKIGALDPRYTFVVRSYELNNPVVLACTFYKTQKDTVYLLYDKAFKTKVVNGKIVQHEAHGLSSIPIECYENNLFLLGDFEPALTILDAINKVASDSENDIEQFVQSLLVFINASLGDDEDERAKNRENIKKNRVVEIKSPKDLQADAKYISRQLEPTSTKNMLTYLEDSLWKIVGIPDRKSRGGGGGDTGAAVELRDGWADLEVVARNKEKYFRKAKKGQLKTILEILKGAGKIDKSLRVRDIDIKFSRNKSANILTKAQSFQTLNETHQLDPVDALEFVDITTNVNEVIRRGQDYWSKKEAELQKQQPTQIGGDQNE